jgi:hypothetical protein
VAVDLKLQEIAKVAEAGGTCPTLHLVTASQMIVGRPGPSVNFAQSVDQPMRSELWEEVRSVAGRKERDGKYDRLLEQVDPGFERMAAVSEPEEPTVLSLFWPTLWAWGESSGLRVPAARVRIDAVSAWWIGGGEEVKGQGGGGWWFGVSVPVGT